MTDFEFWGVIFFKVMLVKIVGEFLVTILSAWLGALAKRSFLEKVRIVMGDKND